ncbi:MAG TPA: fibronectin type III domain-containing protein, partial [Niabella sp.]|nr:fibronectin type III domain-containing protein [Niabella sp.]
MKNIIKPILLLFFSSILLLGCNKDLDEKITSVDFSRLFSPTNLTAVVVNKTSVRLTWVKVNKADSYVIEIFDNGDLNFSGTPVKTIEKVNPDEIPYTVTGLAGETNFSVRVKAKGASIEDSKWSGATFKTDAEQIFLPVDLNEITATQVILRWPAGEVATQIILQPGNITHTVTTAEI